MRFLANENVSTTVIRSLRAAGHDVVAVKEWQPGAADEAVLQRGQADRRVLVTHDRERHFSVVTDDRVRMRPLPVRTAEE